MSFDYSKWNNIDTDDDENDDQQLPINWKLISNAKHDQIINNRMQSSVIATTSEEDVDASNIETFAFDVSNSYIVIYFSYFSCSMKRRTIHLDAIRRIVVPVGVYIFR
jgi:hypothetical protein